MLHNFSNPVNYVLYRLLLIYFSNSFFFPSNNSIGASHEYYISNPFCFKTSYSKFFFTINKIFTYIDSLVSFMFYYLKKHQKSHFAKIKHLPLIFANYSLLQHAIAYISWLRTQSLSDYDVTQTQTKRTIRLSIETGPFITFV